jgi:uncharacterized protein with PIN domain
VNGDPANNDYCDVEQKLADARERMTHLLDQIGGPWASCKACGAAIRFVHHPRTKKSVPYTAEGQNHFIDCPDRDRFRKGKRATATSNH